MTTETLNVRTTKRLSRTAEGKIDAKPNYILLVIGLALVLVQILAVSGRVESPVANATLLGLGITLALYGVYPVSVMNGEFTGPLGRLAVAGPAALGLFVFAYTLMALRDESKQQKELTAYRQASEDVVLLTTSVRDTRHNSRTIGGTTIKLLDVDSFADDRVTHIVDQLDSTLQTGGITDEKARQEKVRNLLASVIPHLRLGQPYQARALAAVDLYLKGEGGANAAWKTVVAEAAADADVPEQVINRVKKLPFAIIEITEATGPRFLALSERGQVPVGSRMYDVPVIANPARRYVPNLEEGIVLTTRAQ